MESATMMNPLIVTCCGLIAIAVGVGPRLSAAQAVESDGAIVPKQLRAMLVDQGYDPFDLGAGAYEVTAGSAGTECRIRVSLAENESMLWLFAYFGEMNPTESLTVDGLLDLLTANEEFGPAYFSVARDGTEAKWLYLNRPLPNNHLTPPRIASAIEDLCAAVRAVIESLDGKSNGPRAD